MDVLTATRDYTDRGFFCVPIPRGEKGPRRKGWQNLRLTAEQLGNEFMPNSNVGVILGEASGWLIDVDLDCEEAVTLAEQYLPPTGMVTGRDGRPRSHWWYMCEGAETVKLHDRAMPGKKATVVELRSSGGQTVVGPSVHPDGGRYDVLTGEPARVPYPMLRACVEALHWAVIQERGHEDENRSNRDSGQPGCERKGNRDEVRVAGRPDRVYGAGPSQQENVSVGRSTRPGDDYNERGDLRTLLEAHGWKVAGKGSDGNWHLTRPGKSHGTSATFNGATFYLHSSSVPGFDGDRGYSPFEVYTRYEHNGDHTAAAAELARQGYGETPDYGVDLSGLGFGSGSIDPVGSRRDNAGHLSGEGRVSERHRSDHPQVADDVGDGGDAGVHNPAGDRHPDREAETAMPEHLLRVPGFISEVIQHTLSTAKNPQPMMAFAGALSLQALLCSRKVCAQDGTPPNLYVLVAATSGSGKNTPRMTNSNIVIQAGLGNVVAGTMGSGPGIEDRLYQSSRVLFQTDEIDEMLHTMSQQAKLGGENKSEYLLNLFSEGKNPMYPCRSLASREGDRPKTIAYPCLNLFGTAIPSTLYNSFSERMITKGLLGRMLIFDAGKRPPSRKASEIVNAELIPESIIEQAKLWGEPTHGGNMESMCPSPKRIPFDSGADRLLEAVSADEDRNYSQSEDDGDNAAMTIWGRYVEKVVKLALLYACSENGEKPVISANGVDWAREVVERQIHRMLQLTREHNVRDATDEKLKRVYDAIKLGMSKCSKSESGWVSKRWAIRKTRMLAREFNEYATTLHESGLIDGRNVGTELQPQHELRIVRSWGS